MTIPKAISDYLAQNSADLNAPVYLYDREHIRANCRLFHGLDYQPLSVHFATMANIHPEFLKTVKSENIHVFVNSLLHLEKVHEAGFRDDQIIFTSSGLDEKTLEYLHGTRIQVNLDSPMQLAGWAALKPAKPVGIRCNVGDRVTAKHTRAGYFIGRESRLGFMPEEIEAIEDKEMINGLHLYAGTDLFDLEYLLDTYRSILDLANLFPALEYINLGGGFGVPENGEMIFDFESYNSRLNALLSQQDHPSGGLKLFLEPGRILAGTAGYFVCRVTDVKQRNGERLAGLNASTAQFTRPLLYPDTAHHPVTVLRNGAAVNGGLTPTTLFGCSTYSRDVFSKKQQLPVIEPGDVIVFGNAGAYCASSCIEFLGFPKPAEIFL